MQNVLPIVGETAEALGQLQCVNISKFLLHMRITLRLTVFKESFQSRSPPNMTMEAAHFLKIVICSSLKVVIFQSGGVQIFQKYRTHLKILGPGRVDTTQVPY